MDRRGHIETRSNRKKDIITLEQILDIMYKKKLKFSGYKAWELLLVLEEIGKRDKDNSIKGEEWVARIIKESEEFRFGILLPITEVEFEGNKERVDNLIRELKLRLLKAGG
jgi:hypothetical protein